MRNLALQASALKLEGLKASIESLALAGPEGPAPCAVRSIYWELVPQAVECNGSGLRYFKRYEN
ncbi:MAG TPA: hypothetical protein VGY31_03920 [Terriglobia bacterium]|nr:hypothetical protein [Terriglobia bacterium]